VEFVGFFFMMACVSDSQHHLLASGTKHQEELREVRHQVPHPVHASGSQLLGMRPQGQPPQGMAPLEERRTDGMKHQRLTEVNHTHIDYYYINISTNAVMSYDVVDYVVAWLIIKLLFSHINDWQNQLTR